jgi:hypothetical protein
MTGRLSHGIMVMQTQAFPHTALAMCGKPIPALVAIFGSGGMTRTDCRFARDRLLATPSDLLASHPNIRLRAAQHSAAAVPTSLFAVCCAVQSATTLVLTDTSMTTTNPLWFHPVFFEPAYANATWWLDAPGNQLWLADGLRFRSHHTNDIPTEMKTLGCSPKPYGTLAARSSLFVDAALLYGSPHPGVVAVSKERL